MAEELSSRNSSNNGMLELAICQPEHPNQAIFISDLNISLQDFRIKTSESALVLPETWVFVTRAGSLVTTDQEENIQVNTITREREDTSVLDVMIAPALTFKRGNRGGPAANHGGSPLSSFATIVGALRDIYVTSIQPNMHELIKPLIIAAFVTAALAFVLSLFLAVSIGALGGMNRSVLVPFLRHHLCAEEETASEISQLYQRIHDLESSMNHMRQVEVGTLACKEDIQLYEEEYDAYMERKSRPIYLPFRKTTFQDAPRVVFGLRGTSIKDVGSMRLEDLRVNSTGFSVKCPDLRIPHDVEYSWIAVGK